MQDVADNSGYSVVENFCGHGTGRYIHMDPLVKHVFVFVFCRACVFIKLLGAGILCFCKTGVSFQKHPTQAPGTWYGFHHRAHLGGGLW
jgi:hypothetical protein